MRTVETFPRAVRDIENVWIPLSDGTRLAARIWLPADAQAAPVPAILEYIPYRKRDFTRRRDEPLHRYFAGHGYAAVRVDLRGTGDSDGVLTDEYTRQEHDDAVEVIAWLAAQPWCTGAVGAMGISWGGFNALQIAARRPPALRAIITLCSTDDRYTDDAHYMGGCLLNENLQWGSVLMNFNAYPPDPEVVGERWRSMWVERLEAATLFPALWLRHQHRDAYWRYGSVCEDYARIACPVYAIGGWADGYSNAVPRLIAGLRVPCKGLVGPWGHAFPHDATPGPPIGFLQEALRWWDQWLKGIDTGIMDEPTYRVWMQDSVMPRPSHPERPGRWVAEAEWPSPRIEWRRWAVNAGTLDERPAGGTPLTFTSLQTTGLGAGDWCAFGVEGEMPTDQRRDDGTSLTFDSAPLAERLEILGAAAVVLDLAVDRPSAFVAARLEDVAPDGSSLRVTYGLLNLAHREGSEHPAAPEPGRRYRARVRLNDVAHVFPAGHVLRLALSTCYWPLAWPSPEPVALTVFPGGGELELPVRPPSPADERLRPFQPPEQAPRTAHVTLRPGRFQRTFERDLASNETVYTVFSDEAEFDGAAMARIEAIGLDLAASTLRRYTITERDPLSARAEVEQKTWFRRGSWSIRVETRIEMSATRDAFVLKAALRAYEGLESVFSREWDEAIPRDHL
jgi:putative CocE/NonD family hydrolase